MSYRIADFGPSDLLTSERENIRRVRVDVAETGFFDGREFRISEELNLDAGNTLVYRFNAPIDFILQLQDITVDAGGLRFAAYRAIQGTEGGTFAPVKKYAVNFMSTAPVYTRQVEISKGGTFTPTDDPVEIIRLVSAGATAKQTTVSSAVGDQRGLAAGVYYLVFTVIGNATASGVFDLKWEERP